MDKRHSLCAGAVRVEGFSSRDGVPNLLDCQYLARSCGSPTNPNAHEVLVGIHDVSVGTMPASHTHDSSRRPYLGVLFFADGSHLPAQPSLGNETDPTLVA